MPASVVDVDVIDIYTSAGKAQRNNRRFSEGAKMSKALLSTAIKDATDCSRAEANQAVTAMVEAIITTLKADGKFVWAGLGSWSVPERKASIGRHPQTGAPINVPASRVMRFKPVSSMRSEFNTPAVLTTETAAVTPPLAAAKPRAAKVAAPIAPAVVTPVAPLAAKKRAAKTPAVVAEAAALPKRRARNGAADAHAG